MVHVRGLGTRNLNIMAVLVRELVRRRDALGADFA
jgi:hypothetical protein